MDYGGDYCYDLSRLRVLIYHGLPLPWAHYFFFFFFF